uniref:Uncharacterized protein n=1 Tax=Rhizophora mucronata TaxID=61149 RepID=A0A2P2PND1_RHIMU
MRAIEKGKKCQKDQDTCICRCTQIFIRKVHQFQLCNLLLVALF